MGFFDKLFGKNEKQETDAGSAEPKPEITSREMMDAMLDQALACLEGGAPERAVAMYRNILEVEPKQSTALYNLASLMAQGKGAPRDYLEAGTLFRQAEQCGDEQAGKLCKKCLMDFMHESMARDTASELYADVLRFMRRVYPEANAEEEASRNLLSLAGLHLNRKEFAPAAKLLRPAAEFGNDGMSQNYLGVLYNLGGGVRKNDLAALYWFDRAVDNGAEVARRDRDGILNAYRANLSADEFRREMLELSGWCAEGTEDIPKDAAKAARWRETAEA